MLTLMLEHCPVNADFNVGALSITGQVAGVPWASVVVCQCGRSQYFAAWRPAKHTHEAGLLQQFFPVDVCATSFSSPTWSCCENGICTHAGKMGQWGRTWPPRRIFDILGGDRQWWLLSSQPRRPDQCKTQTVRSHVEADPPFMLHFTFCFKKVGKNEVEGIT